MKFWPFNRSERRDAGNDPSWANLQTATGQHVDAKAAESIAAVYACVQALSESTACLPLHVYQRAANGDRERVSDHPLARVLREPNDYQSGMAFREAMTAAVLMQGNAYAVKEYNGAGELTALHPLAPRSVSVLRLASGRYVFDVAQEDGGTRRYLQDEIFHLRDRCEPGSIIGKSRIQVARETLGLSLAMRDHGTNTFRNAARPSGVIIPERPLNSDQAADFKKAMDGHRGVWNAGKVLLMPIKGEFKQLSMSLEDSEWVGGMQYSTEEVARIFRVPPTMIGDLRFGNYSNSVEMGAQFVRYSLQRPIAMWESEIQRSLLGPIARQRYYAEHAVEGLLRGAPEARAEFYAKAIASGWMTVNEVRSLENLAQLPVDEKIAGN